MATGLRLLAEHRFAIDSTRMPERAGAEPDHQKTAFECLGVTRAFGYQQLNARKTNELRPAVGPRTVDEARAVLARFGY